MSHSQTEFRFTYSSLGRMSHVHSSILSTNQIVCIHVHAHILSLSFSMNTLGVSMSTIHITQVRLFKILATLVHQTQPDQQHSSQFLPYTNTHTHTEQKGERGKKVHTSQTAPQDTLKSVNGCFLFPLYECLCGDLGSPGLPGETIHKLK